MKLYGEKDRPPVAFVTVRSGDVFRWGINLYMRLCSRPEAVILTGACDGVVSAFKDDEQVYPVNASLYIEGSAAK